MKSSGKVLWFDFGINHHHLIDGCNPKYFIDNSDLSKLKTATDFYTRLKSLKSSDNPAYLLQIRKQAEEKLGIRIPCEDLYQTLCEVFNPQQFVDDNFDKDKLLASTRAFQYIKENKNDRRKLEKLAYVTGLMKFEFEEKKPKQKEDWD